jgi:hypothetical protein
MRMIRGMNGGVVGTHSLGSGAVPIRRSETHPDCYSCKVASLRVGYRA